MKFLLDCSFMSFCALVSGSDNRLLRKLMLYTFNDVKVCSVFMRYNIFDYTNVHHIKRCVRLKFNEYCDVDT